MHTVGPRQALVEERDYIDRPSRRQRGEDLGALGEHVHMPCESVVSRRSKRQDK